MILVTACTIITVVDNYNHNKNHNLLTRQIGEFNNAVV